MATHIDAAETAATAYHPEICPNCGSDLSGEYCNHCGQKKIHRQEFSVKHFTRQALNEVTDLESNKVFKTLVALLFRPGILAAEYLAGRKGKFVSPIRLYLTFSAIYFLFAWGALSDIRGGGSARAARNPATIAMARARGVDPQALADRVYEKAEKYAGTIRFMSVLISGLFLSLLYYSMKRFYVEHLIFSLYYYSFDFFMKSFFALLFIVSAALGSKLPRYSPKLVLSGCANLSRLGSARCLQGNVAPHCNKGCGVVFVRIALVHCCKHCRVHDCFCACLSPQTKTQLVNVREL